MSNIIMDRTNTPTNLWYLCLEYVVYVLNHLATKSLKWRTPIEAATGDTPDISNLLQFHWYESVYYYDPSSPYPLPKEKVGRFLGVAENVGDTLTYKILTSDTQEVIYRSVVRPIDAENANLRADEQSLPPRSQPSILSESDFVADVNYPEIDPEQLIGYTFVVERPSGNYRAEVVQQIEDNHDKFIVKVGDSGREEILHYNDLISEIEKA